MSDREGKGIKLYKIQRILDVLNNIKDDCGRKVAHISKTDVLLKATDKQIDYYFRMLVLNH